MSLKPLRSDPSLSEGQRRMGERINRAVIRTISDHCKQKHPDNFQVFRLYECEWVATEKEPASIYVGAKLLLDTEDPDFQDSQGFSLKIRFDFSILPSLEEKKEAAEFCRKIAQATRIPVNYLASHLTSIEGL